MRGVSVFVTIFTACASAALINSIRQHVYDTSEEILLIGGPFEGNDSQIHLTFSPPLRRRVDYDLTVRANWQIALRLNLGKRWVITDDERTPAPLTLLKFQDDANKDAAMSVLETAVVVAQIFPTPKLHSSTQIVSQTTSEFLVIHGAGFGTSMFKPIFYPHLTLGVDYDLHDLTPSQATLVLRPGARWRNEPGLLWVRGLDTGGGMVEIRRGLGMQVAVVQTEMQNHTVKVDTNEGMKMYQPTYEFVITGEGFNEHAHKNNLQFANSFLDQRVTVVKASSHSLTVRLDRGVQWFEYALPTRLILLAINVGNGFVAVGPEGGRAGCNVATLYERPRVSESRTQLSRTDSRELNIFGRGFLVDAATDVELEFEQPLARGIDYQLRVLNPNRLQLSLLDGRSWGDTGPLTLKSISTIGPGGLIPLNGVQVAEIIPDIHVDIPQVEQKIYQSTLRQSLVIRGRNFKSGMSLAFRSGIQEGVDYDMRVENSTFLRLSLRCGKKWTNEAGPLTLTAVKADGVENRLVGGIQIASVLPDPSVLSTSVTLHATDSKTLWLLGSGFTDIKFTRVSFARTRQDAFHIEEVLPDKMRLRLNDGKAWDSHSLGRRKLLELVSIDTGAGEIMFHPPVALGQVIRDHAHGRCDDSCEFAVDGICSDLDFAQLPQESYAYGHDDYLMNEGKHDNRQCAPGTDCTDCQNDGIS